MLIALQQSTVPMLPPLPLCGRVPAMRSSHAVRRLQANRVSCACPQLSETQVTHQNFLRIADAPCEISDRAIRLDYLGGKLDTEPASRQCTVLPS